MINNTKLVRKHKNLRVTPFTEREDINNEEKAHELIGAVVEQAREVISTIADATQAKWEKGPRTAVRAVFGHWYVKAIRHLEAMNILCSVRDFSVVANVHHRQIFEIYLQTRYFSSLSEEKQRYYAEKISAIGCIEYLEKLDKLKEHPYIESAYNEMEERLDEYDVEIVEEIRNDRKNRRYSWFGGSFSWLAREVSGEDEDLCGVYQIISADIHGAWDLTLDVDNPEPGKLDFRGYPDKKTMYIRGAETLDQATNHLMNLWNEIAVSVGAPEVYYSIENGDKKTHST